MSKSEFGKTVKALNEQQGDRLPCNRCDTPTAHATLAQYGGRCFGCYEAYCRAAFDPQPPHNDTPTQREMRKHLRGFKPANVLNRPESDYLDPERIAAAKRDAQAKFDAFSRLSVEQRTASLRDSGDIGPPDEFALEAGPRTRAFSRSAA